MKHFVYSLITLLQIGFLCNAAQVGFNRVGYVINVPGDSSGYNGVAVDSQGRIIVVGDTDTINGLNRGLIARFLANGSLDTTFNETGFINQAGDTNSFGYNSVAIDSQDRIVVVGSTDGGDGLIARYLPNGELDQAFNLESVNGAPGFINQEGDTNSFGYNSVAIDSQGRIIVVGRTDGNGGNTVHGLIARYLPNGTLDTTFNEPYGFINADLPTDSYLYNEVAIDSQGRIIVVGRTDQVNASFNGLITRFNNEGILDVTFNRTGFISNIPGNSFEYHSVAIDSQGRIIVVGETDGAGVAVNGLIARFLSNGVLDAESNWNLNNYRENANINHVFIGLLG